MFSYAKVKDATGGQSVAYTAPIVINRANIDRTNLNLFDYVTQGTSDDIEFDYAMPNNAELNFD